MFDKTSLKNDISAGILDALCAGDSNLANSIAETLANSIDAYVRKVKVQTAIPVSTSGGGGATTAPGNLE